MIVLYGKKLKGVRQAGRRVEAVLQHPLGRRLTRYVRCHLSSNCAPGPIDFCNLGSIPVKFLCF